MRAGHGAFCRINLARMTRPPVIALIVAAGRGVRAGEGLPKQYRMLGGKPVLARTIEALLAGGVVQEIVTVIHRDDSELYAAALDKLDSGGDVIGAPVHGGETRAASVGAGLEAIAARHADATVLIHDGARPFPSPALIRAAAELGRLGAAIPVLPLADTVKQVGADGLVRATPDRATLRAVQTPQAFPLALILDAHRKAAADGRGDATDDAALIEHLGLPVATFPGEPCNIKLTTAHDFELAEKRLRATLITRVGTGYDVHAFTDGDHVTLAGVRIPHERGVLAHSDGDVAIHALCDAIFGALGEGDIGQHFPPSDPRWKNAPSSRFLAFACERVVARGGIIDHIDISIVCERPKVGPHRAEMLATLAAITGLAPTRIGLKATTSERLGFTGRGEGLAALATVTLRLPEEA
jgi:2-C-methyl-D-erythritol 4-phosphate cytidylyltransferase/2-C-methyl-D-erythritol 2,4-cyclodiphosphate synthase